MPPDEPTDNLTFQNVAATAAGIAQRMPLRVAVLTVLVLQVLVYAFFLPSYETNDDVFMTMAASGRGIATAPDAHLMFTNVILGEGLKRLYTSWPGVPWYGAYLLVVHFVSQAAILYCVLMIGRKPTDRDTAVRWGLYLLYFAVVELPMLVGMQFTTTAFVATQAGMFLFLLAWLRGARQTGEAILGPLTVAVLLVTLGGLIRLESLVMALLVAAPVALLFVREYPKRALAPCGVALLAAAALIIGATAYDQQAYEQDPQWQGFRSLNQLRGVFHDAAWTYYSPETAPLFSQVGWTENDHAMITEWFSDDSTLYSRQNLEAIVAGRPWRSERPLASLWLSTLGDVLGTRLVLAVLLALPLALLAVRGGRNARWAVLGSCAAALVLIAGITWAKKAPPARVYLPLVSFPLSACLLSLAWRNKETETPSQPDGARPPLWSWEAWQSRTMQRRVALVLMIAAVAMGASKQMRRSKHTAHGQAALRQLLDEIQSSEKKLYVTWEASLPYEQVSPLDNLNAWPPASMLSLAWPQRTPWHEEVKRRHGITNLARDLYQRDDIELIARPQHHELFVKYALEHYGARVAFEPSLEAGDKFVVGRYEQIPKSLGHAVPVGQDVRR